MFWSILTARCIPGKQKKAKPGQPEIDGTAVSRVRAVSNELASGNEIIITIESADAHKVDPIIELLDEGGFDYQSKGSHNGKSYHINARRKVH